MKDKILKFIKDETYTVISSVNAAGQPESALVGFSQTDDMQIVVGSEEQTRKVQNIMLNPNISLVIGLGGKHLTSVQLEGTARVVRKDDIPELVEAHYNKIPSAMEHKDDPEQCFIVFSPTWARYTNHSVSPAEIIEDYLDVD